MSVRQVLKYGGQKYRNTAGQKIEFPKGTTRKERDDLKKDLINWGDLTAVKPRKAGGEKRKAPKRKCNEWEYTADGSIERKKPISMKKIRQERMKKVRAGKK